MASDKAVQANADAMRRQALRTSLESNPPLTPAGWDKVETSTEDATFQQTLDRMAVNMVGDGSKPNLYFVSVQGAVRMVTTDGDAAYEYWEGLPTSIETCFEDRVVGTLADTSPESDEPNARLVTCDEWEYHRTK